MHTHCVETSIRKQDTLTCRHTCRSQNINEHHYNHYHHQYQCYQNFACFETHLRRCTKKEKHKHRNHQGMHAHVVETTGVCAPILQRNPFFRIEYFVETYAFHFARVNSRGFFTNSSFRQSKTSKNLGSVTFYNMGVTKLKVNPRDIPFYKMGPDVWAPFPTQKAPLQNELQNGR